MIECESAETRQVWGLRLGDMFVCLSVTLYEGQRGRRMKGDAMVITSSHCR